MIHIDGKMQKFFKLYFACKTKPKEGLFSSKTDKLVRNHGLSVFSSWGNTLHIGMCYEVKSFLV